jgi:hypothetical protein
LSKVWINTSACQPIVRDTANDDDHPHTQVEIDDLRKIDGGLRLRGLAEVS